MSLSPHAVAWAQQAQGERSGPARRLARSDQQSSRPATRPRLAAGRSWPQDIEQGCTLSREPRIWPHMPTTRSRVSADLRGHSASVPREHGTAHIASGVFRFVPSRSLRPSEPEADCSPVHPETHPQKRDGRRGNRGARLRSDLLGYAITSRIPRAPCRRCSAAPARSSRAPSSSGRDPASSNAATSSTGTSRRAAPCRTPPKCHPAWTSSLR